MIGAHTQMTKFEHLFGIFLGTLVLKHSDNLSRTLQRYMTAQDGCAVAQLTVKTIEKMKNDETFLWFWRKCIQKGETEIEAYWRGRLNLSPCAGAG